ncbi:MAG: 4Fe-4S dicluster domain-containing protein, partial [Shewanellaceae bacterium]|nr:4Fe-4S dicluster domain-containing protein [Shewanellaceae bacterium]
PQAHQKIIIGGPMMGYTLPALDVPVVKATNCILVPQAAQAAAPEMNCIRCSACVDACPANLLPQQLYWFAKGGDHQKSKDYHLFDCIECGCCAYVCPSNIPLVQYYRVEKAQIQQSEQEAKQAKIAKDKFEARQARLEAAKQARRQRQERSNKERTTTSAQQDLIAAAIARAKAKKSPAPTEAAVPPATPDRNERLQAALERAKAKQKRNSRDEDS